MCNVLSKDRADERDAVVATEQAAVVVRLDLDVLVEARLLAVHVSQVSVGFVILKE